MEEIQVFFIDNPRALAELVDDPVFSHVSDCGEIYSLFEIVTITREYLNHPLKWTHGATVLHRESNKQYSADLRVVNFCIEESVIHDFS